MVEYYMIEFYYLLKSLFPIFPTLAEHNNFKKNVLLAIITSN